MCMSKTSTVCVCGVCFVWFVVCVLWFWFECFVCVCMMELMSLGMFKSMYFDYCRQNWKEKLPRRSRWIWLKI